ncbi:MAG: PKD domain-containing protein, partial [Chitinophagales bacterium]|nr:PKD domain-containing protein [Chitinophagales bacterium]MDW8427325.1 PKD domain-containing protein [Chitinophagales bacterium]
MRTFFSLLALMVFLFPRESIAQSPTVTQDPSYACLGPGGATGGQQCQFVVCSGDTATYTVSLQADTYFWNILTLSGPSPVIIGGNTSAEFVVYYPAAGLYYLQVELTVGGGSAQGGGAVYFVGGNVCAVESVIADFTTSYPVNNGCIDICKNTTVTFYNNSSANTETSIWNFGDGSVLVTNGAGPVTHTYTTPGSYTVTLTAKTECCSDEATLCVNVDSREGPDIFCVSQICGDDAGVQYCTNATCTSYDWNIIPASAGSIVSGAGTSCITV